MLSMTTLHITDVRARLLKLVDDARMTHEPIQITNNGRRTAVLMGADDYDAMVETIASLSDPTHARATQRGHEEVGNARTLATGRPTGAMRNVIRGGDFEQ
jgi:antitoxin YefM